MSLRVLAGAAVGAALAGFAIGALSLRDADAIPPAAPARAASAPADPAGAEPLPPALFSGADRPLVPAGILARAASARALERAPTCPVPEQQEPLRCVPEQRESIEIEWHVSPREP